MAARRLPSSSSSFEREPSAWDQPDAAQARAFYAHVLHLTRTDPAFLTGDLRPVATSASADVIAYARGGAVVLVNVRARSLSVGLTGVSVDGMRDVLANRTLHGAAVALPAYGAVVLERVTPE